MITSQQPRHWSFVLKEEGEEVGNMWKDDRQFILEKRKVGKKPAKSVLKGWGTPKLIPSTISINPDVDLWG